MIKLNVEFSRKTEDEILKMQEKSIQKKQILLSKHDLIAYKEFIVSQTFNLTVAAEFSEWINDGKEIKRISKINNIPTCVICRDEQISVKNYVNSGVPELDAIIYEKHWRLLQKDLVRLSNKSKLIIAEGCDHMIHLENPEVIIKTLNSIDRANIESDNIF